MLHVSQIMSIIIFPKIECLEIVSGTFYPLIQLILDYFQIDAYNNYQDMNMTTISTKCRRLYQDILVINGERFLALDGNGIYSYNLKTKMHNYQAIPIIPWYKNNYSSWDMNAFAYHKSTPNLLYITNQHMAIVWNIDTSKIEKEWKENSLNSIAIGVYRGALIICIYVHALGIKMYNAKTWELVKILKVDPCVRSYYKMVIDEIRERLYAVDDMSQIYIHSLNDIDSWDVISSCKLRTGGYSGPETMCLVYGRCGNRLNVPLLYVSNHDPVGDEKYLQINCVDLDKMCIINTLNTKFTKYGGLLMTFDNVNDKLLLYHMRTIDKILISNV
jgi:hypothetical protein